jgi:hemoglobin/transferrin/lactoferrin receptor protein
MHQYSFPFFLVLLVFFPLAVRGMIPGGLSGAVTDDEGTPLAGVHVSLPDLQRIVVTDERGVFFIPGIEAGAYRLRVSHIGYRVVELRVLVGQDAVSSVPVIRLFPTPVNMGEVSVYSTRSEELLRNVPLPMSVAVSEQLLRTPAIGIVDALDVQPGVALIRDGPWATDISIRGLGRSNVVTLIDGARIETSTNIAAGLSLVDISDVDRIEVIRGAASTLYGTGATGGVINIISASGGYRESLAASAAFTSGYSSVNDGAMGALSIAAGASNWHARLHGRVRSAADMQTPEGLLADSRFRDRSIAVSTGVRVWGSHEITARYQLVQARDVGIPGGAAFPGAASARYPEAERELLTATWSAALPVPGMQRMSLRYIRQTIEREVELAVNPTTTVRPSAEHIMDGVQLQSNWLPGGSHRLTAGVDVWQRQYTGRRIRELRARNTVIADMPLPDAVFRSIGAYAQDEFSMINDRMRATLGGRIDLIDVWNDAAFDLLYTEVNGVRNDAPSNRVLRWPASESRELSWSAYSGLLYSLHETLDLSFNAAQSFRAPALEERYQYIELGGATYLGDPALSAERGSCFDFGLRYRSARMSVSTNVFANFMRDLVVDAQEADTLYIKRNIGHALLTGFELLGEYTPYANVTLYTGFSLLRGRDTGNDSNLPSISPVTLQTGVRLPLFDILHADVRFTVTADQERVAEGETITPGVALVDLGLRSTTTRLGGLGVQLFGGVENLLNRAYRRHISTLRGMNRLEAGRNIYVRLRLLW